MDNAKPMSVVRDMQKADARSQGGTQIEGRSGDPAGHCESPPQGTGHSSAKSGGVKGHLYPGKKGGY